MESSQHERWSTRKTTIPDTINQKLVGTFPAVVIDDDSSNTGQNLAAFFIRAPVVGEESAGFVLLSEQKSKKKLKCTVKPKFVKTPYGPLVMVYGMIDFSSIKRGVDPYVSETAIFPRLETLPSHKEITELMISNHEVFYVIGDEYGNCIFNDKAYVVDLWRDELFEKRDSFYDEPKQITDEKEAISALIWYQQRFKPTPEIFEVNT